ncbi:MAG TPA: hypothetical protein VHZ54_19500 [Solirubrobacterales bacterium]|jgi:hypothetical protein|nr:hypothetical protein [Solirubrobacterales bacterium]
MSNPKRRPRDVSAGLDRCDRERLLRDALQSTRAPDEGPAEDRAWRVVAGAAASGERAPIRRGKRRRAVQVALVLGLIAVLVSPAGASVRHWVADRIEPGAPHARPVLSALPGDGSLLVESPRGPWVVYPDGSKRLLGAWHEASWSPHGLYAVVTRRHEIAAVEPDGTVRWALARPGWVGKARWNGPDGYRIAYLEGNRLRVVDGDGTDDRLLARHVAWVAPAWKPGPGHAVAYATPGGDVLAVGADSDREVLRSDGRGGVLFLQWTGGRLLVTRTDRLQLLDRSGRATWTWTAPPGTTIGSAVARGGRVAVVTHDQDGGTSRLLLLARGHKPRVLFAGPGDLGPPRWSPDGRWLLAPWPRADQWLFLQPGTGSAKLHAVANVAAQFSPGDAKGARFPSVVGWSHQR